ncbi:MAG TPA: protein kinase, partial [Candidatus Binatia bacterium]
MSGPIDRTPPQPADPMEGFAGTDRFKPLALLGRGSMGIVYRIHDRETDTEVALKTLGARAPEQLYQLKQEFRSLGGILHPNLVELYELVVDEREGFFTMELIDGVDFVEYV